MFDKDGMQNSGMDILKKSSIADEDFCYSVDKKSKRRSESKIL